MVDPSNEAFLILDNCVQSLLHMKDNECLDTDNIQTVVTNMMDKLTENRRKNVDSSMEFLESDDEIDRTTLSGDNSISSPCLPNE